MYTADLPAQIDQSVLLADVYFYALDEVQFGLVLTPKCDLAQQKADLVLLCCAYRAWDLIEELIRTDWAKLGVVSSEGLFSPLGSLSKNQTNSLKGNLKSLIDQKFPRFHWLSPPPGEADPLILDFQNVTSVTLEDLEGSRPVAELLSPFREQVPARYAAYVSRVGTPDVTEADKTEWINSAFERLFPPG